MAQIVCLCACANFYCWTCEVKRSARDLRGEEREREGEGETNAAA